MRRTAAALLIVLASCATPSSDGAAPLAATPPSAVVSPSAPPTTTAPKVTTPVRVAMQLDLPNEPRLTVSFPSKIVPNELVAPRLGSLRATFEKALTARKAALKARRNHAYVFANESGRTVRDARERSEAADDADRMAFASARRDIDRALGAGGGDRVALLLAREYLGTSAEDESNATVASRVEIVGFGVDPGAYVRKEDAKCEAALAAARSGDPLMGYLVQCVDRRRFSSLQTSGLAALESGKDDDVALLAKCPKDGVAALHARRALRAVVVGALDVAERSIADALAALPSDAPSEAELLFAGAEIAARRGDDALALTRASRALGAVGIFGSRRGLDVAVDAWVRSGAPLGGNDRGEALASAAASIVELARGRRAAAADLARKTTNDPLACAIASTALREVRCLGSIDAMTRATATGAASGLARLAAERAGEGSSEQRVLRTVVRACVLRNLNGPPRAAEYDSSGDATDQDARCIRDAMARVLPGTPYTARVRVDASSSE